MAKFAIAEARPPHADRRFANSGILIEAGLPAARVALRAHTGNIAKLSKPLGLKLPTAPLNSTTGKSRSALWLGPDEWLVIDSNPAAIDPLMNNLATVKCSFVDISHRNTSILVSGESVEKVLNAGCPRDLGLDAFPVGNCSRTLFGKIEIVLWRLDENMFHIEVWRSFSEYLWDFLIDASRSV